MPTLAEIQNFSGKYPKQLYLLFFTEMWERFTFYGMRALLVLFMTSQLHFDDIKSNMLYGVYQSLIYAMPVIGGLMADRYLGFQRSIIFGAVLMAIGSFVLAIPNTTTYFFGMSVIVVGNGYFKPNISSIVGNLYKEGDSRRDAGFSLFYMGINVGAMLGGLICGYVGQEINWHAGFGLAGIFMLVGLVTFLKGRKNLGPVGLAPNETFLKEKILPIITKEQLIYIASIVTIPLFVWILFNYNFYSYLINAFGVLSLVYVLYLAVKEGKAVLQLIMAALVLIIFSALFWAFYEQGGGSLNLFTDRHVNLNFFGVQLSSAALNNGIAGAMIVLLSPIFAWLWLWLSKKNIEPNAAIKFALALLQLGLGFYCFILGAAYVNEAGRIPLLFFVLAYFFMCTGELCISPIGLSVITKLSPPKMVGLMMGVWFLASSYGQYLAGWIGSLMAIPTNEGDIKISPAASLAIYNTTFLQIAIISVCSGVLLLLLSPFLKKMMQGKA